MRNAVLLVLVSFSVCNFVAFAQTDFEVYTDNRVYIENQPLFVYGTTIPNDGVIVRLSAPDGTIVFFDQTVADKDGAFNYTLFVWPKSSDTIPFGTYTVEAISSGTSLLVDITFAAGSEFVQAPVVRYINTLVFVPDTAAINEPLRVFVQTTSDGLLVAGDPTKILRTSHVHLPDGSATPLYSEFRALHQGLYYVDYTPQLLGTYVFHIVAFHQGTTSHGSAVTRVLSSDIGGISKQIINLDRILSQTSNELDRLKFEISGFGSSLDIANSSIDSSVTSMRSSVTNIENASSQLNSLFFPIVAFVGVIVALQLVIIARRRVL